MAKNKALVDDAEALLGHNLDLHADLRKRDEDLKGAEHSCIKVEVACKEA